MTAEQSNIGKSVNGSSQLEVRVETLEREVAQVSSLDKQLALVQAKLAEVQKLTETLHNDASWTSIIGSFKDDPTFDEAVRLGKAWRSSDTET